MAKIIDHLSQGEILAQMAEELAEAAQAALKLRRALDDSNPTPKTIPECWESLEEEIGDVMNCIDALLLEDNLNYHSFMSKCGEKAEPKMSRWKQRLEARYAKNEDDTV